MSPSKPRKLDRAALGRKRYADGLVDEDGTTRRARTLLCRRCGVPIFTGLDADRCAFTVRVDPGPIDARGELVAVMTGRRTYRLSWRGQYELDPRTEIEIAAQPPTEVEVLAEHRCGQPIPVARIRPPAPRRAPKTAPGDPERPPY